MMSVVTVIPGTSLRARLHRGEHTVGAGLDRQVQILADLGNRPDHFEDIGGEIPWVRRLELHSFYPVDSGDLFEKPGERSCTRVASVRVDILSQQHDFNRALIREALHLLDDIFQRSASLCAPDTWNDTV
jgi:hypothetical protein